MHWNYGCGWAGGFTTSHLCARCMLGEKTPSLRCYRAKLISSTGLEYVTDDQETPWHCEAP